MNIFTFSETNFEKKKKKKIFCYKMAAKTFFVTSPKILIYAN